MKDIERMKLVRELIGLNAELKGASDRERMKKCGRILAILKMLGVSIKPQSPAESPVAEKPAEVSVEAETSVNPEWAEDRETLQSIIDGKHEAMKSPRLYDILVEIDRRQKDNPEYPPLFEQAVNAWEKAVYEVTEKIAA